ESTLTTNLNAEIARAEAAEAALSSRISSLEGGGAGTYAEVYTTMQQNTSVSIANPSGRPVQLTVNAYPGSITNTDGGGVTTTYEATGSVLRGSTPIGSVGYQDSPTPFPTLSPTLDHPGTGTITYAVDFSVSPDVAATVGSTDWTSFAYTAYCYIFVQLM
ncbi:MAG TPA: hypothetical protein VGH84_06665, partial [Steroidobacteraceae bacterium]